MAKPSTLTALTELPNIGPRLAELLDEVGIATPAQLQRLGSVVAAALLQPRRPPGSACRSMLCPLEGAIRGVRWHQIPKGERDRLWQDFEQRLSRG